MLNTLNSIKSLAIVLGTRIVINPINVQCNKNWLPTFAPSTCDGGPSMIQDGWVGIKKLVVTMANNWRDLIET